MDTTDCAVRSATLNGPTATSSVIPMASAISIVLPTPARILHTPHSARTTLPGPSPRHPGLSTIDAIAVRLTASLVVAVRPPTVPTGTGPLPSVRIALMFPPPVPTELVRRAWPAGWVQLGTVEDSLAQ